MLLGSGPSPESESEGWVLQEHLYNRLAYNVLNQQPVSISEPLIRFCTKIIENNA